MKITLLAAAAALTLAGGAGALAQSPALVSVAIGPELQAKAHKTYGQREVDRLADDLQTSVERALARSAGPAADGARLELVLVDAKPNRPTFKELGDRPGLSFESFGVGGATIGGRAVLADGSVVPISYRWYETDIRQVLPATTWSDAQRTFSLAASRIARGEYER